MKVSLICLSASQNPQPTCPQDQMISMTSAGSVTCCPSGHLAPEASPENLGKEGKGFECCPTVHLVSSSHAVCVCVCVQRR